jgi:ATP-dependent protease Clp ATPase subunit
MSEAVVKCSFCGKDQYLVAKVVVSKVPEAAICDECVPFIAEVIEEEIERDRQKSREQDQAGCSENFFG